MLDVKRLRLLVELSRRGTIAAVAQALSYSPSAVSQQLAVLEREAGAALLEPVGRRVRLTGAGEALVAHAQLVLAELERAEAAVAAARDEVAGTVRVAAFQTAVLALLPGALIALGQAHAGLRVEVAELEPEVSLPALAAGDFDVVLGEEYPGYPRPRLPGVERVELLSDRLLLVAPTTWGRVGLADLAHRPFAMEPVGTTSREWSMGVCRTAGFEPDVQFTSTDLQVQLRLVAHGLAAALLPELAQPELAQPDSAQPESAQAEPGQARQVGVRVQRLDGDPARRVFAATRAGAGPRPALRAVVEALRLERAT